MDCAGIKVEMYGGGQLDPLVIVEEGDETQGVPSEGSPASGEELGDSGEAAIGEEVAGQKERNEGLGSASDRKNDVKEVEEERKTTAVDMNIGCTETGKEERAKSCEQQLEGTKSLEEDPKKVSGHCYFSYGTEKNYSFCSITNAEL